MRAYDGLNPAFSAADVRSALTLIKQKRKLDPAGLCTAAIESMLFAHEAAAVAATSKLIANDINCKWIEIAGRVYGKGIEDTSAQLLPLHSAATSRRADPGHVAFIMAAQDLRQPLARLAAFVGKGAHPNTQCLEIATNLHICIEKILEAKSEGAIIQADIKRFYDCIRVIRCCRLLISKGADAAKVIAILRFQIASTVSISVLGQSRKLTNIMRRPHR